MSATAPAGLAPVLYVEDEENDVLLMEMAFRRTGIAHPLRTAKNGIEALDQLRAAAKDPQRPMPALVLLDLNMPRMSGFELLQHLKEEFPTANFPVVVFSSSGQTPDIARARELGASDYLVKPVTFAAMIETVAHLKAKWLT